MRKVSDRSDAIAQVATSDPRQKNGIQSDVFGPVIWESIHMVSFNYPLCPSQADRDRHRRWLLALGEVLPCRYCRENFDENMRTAGFGDAAFDSRASFSRFCYDLHNSVNAALGKPRGPPYEEVRATYERVRASCNKSTPDRPVSGEAGCVDPVAGGARYRSVVSVLPRSA